MQGVDLLLQFGLQAQTGVEVRSSRATLSSRLPVGTMAPLLPLRPRHLPLSPLRSLTGAAVCAFQSNQYRQRNNSLFVQQISFGSNLSV